MIFAQISPPFYLIICINQFKNSTIIESININKRLIVFFVNIVNIIPFVIDQFYCAFYITIFIQKLRGISR